MTALKKMLAKQLIMSEMQEETKTLNPGINGSRFSNPKFIKTLVDVELNNPLTICLDRFPGNFHLYFYSIEKFISHPTDLISITVKAKGTSNSSNKFPIKPFVKPSLYVTIPITEKFPTKFAVDINIAIHKPEDCFKGDNSVINCELFINNEEINSMQNNLIEKKFKIKQKDPLLTRLTSSFFQAKAAQYPECRCFCSYISNDDTKMFRSRIDSLATLTKWVSFRRMAFNLLFEGYLNIKSKLNGYTWEKKYAKCYGYTLIILNPHNREIEHVLDISVNSPMLDAISKRIVRVETAEMAVEIECLDTESFKKFILAALCSIPQNIQRIWLEISAGPVSIYLNRALYLHGMFCGLTLLLINVL